MDWQPECTLLLAQWELGQAPALHDSEQAKQLRKQIDGCARLPLLQLLLSSIKPRPRPQLGMHSRSRAAMLATTHNVYLPYSNACIQCALICINTCICNLSFTVVAIMFLLCRLEEHVLSWSTNWKRCFLLTLNNLDKWLIENKEHFAPVKSSD